AIWAISPVGRSRRDRVRWREDLRECQRLMNLKADSRARGSGEDSRERNLGDRTARLFEKPRRAPPCAHQRIPVADELGSARHRRAVERIRRTNIRRLE